MGWFFTIIFVMSATETSPQQRMGPFRTQQECEAAKLNITTRMPAARATICTREQVPPGTPFLTPQTPPAPEPQTPRR